MNFHFLAITLALLSFQTCFAIRCHTCIDRPEELCDNETDNGKEEQCEDEFTTCMYFSASYNGNSITQRGCSDHKATGCFMHNVDGVPGKACYCDQDLCNNEKECSCEPTTPSNQLVCQSCVDRPDELCDNESDNGKEEPCENGYNTCFYFHAQSTHENSVTQRGCSEHQEVGCFDHSINGFEGKACYCDSNNCNIGQECSCNDKTTTPPNGLRCQSCVDRPDELCDNESDNGKEELCENGYNTCFYFHASSLENSVTQRGCSRQWWVGCFDHSINGVEGKACYCDTNNCNTGKDCYCEDETTTQSNEETTPPSNDLHCQSCIDRPDETCDNESDNGKDEPCEKDYTSCMYFHANGEGDTSITQRSCSKHEVGCFEYSSDGFKGKACYCDTNNCNKDDQCSYCSSAYGLRFSTLVLLGAYFIGYLVK